MRARGDMANLKVSIIEKVKQADGTWTNVTVKLPKSKPGNKGLYLKDRREGKFYLLWREGKRRVYHPVEGSLSEASNVQCGAWRISQS